ncbi:MAG TPA: NAD(P)-dependent oxidoreductase [Caulobacteraceae bacterium]|jgi:nucleoside-diphosphate-sugar epimerase
MAEQRDGAVLVTGDRGYIGSVLTGVLQERGYAVVGLDVGYFADCALAPPPGGYKQIVRDIRDVTEADLEGVSAVIHLAGLSNDPLGEFAPALTDEINFEGTLKIARLAKAAGVERFVYASSQSMYGLSSTDAELEEDSSTKNPITAYARTKWEAEQKLADLIAPGFTLVSFRPSTVFGWSPRLRCDIVYNNLVACAFTTGRIEIMSDGTPWRPVVHVRDVCAAFISGLEAPAALVNGRAYNVGIPNGNFTVRDLAEAAGRAVPGCEVVFTGQHGKDARTYRVSFERILTELADWYKPSWDLDKGGAELVENFRKVGFTEAQFRGRATNRLAQLNQLVADKRLDAALRW